MKKIGYPSPDDMMSGIKYNDQIAKGQIQSIITDLIKTSDIDTFQSNKDSTAQAAKAAKEKLVGGKALKPTSYAVPVSKAILAAASYRDSRYSLFGRKFMRIAGLTGNNVSFFHRMQGLVRYKKFREEDIPVKEPKPKDYKED